MKLLIKNILSTLTFMLLSLAAMTQSDDKSYSDIESAQEEIELLYVDIYDVLELYPEVTYEYVYEGEEIIDVTIYGLDNPTEEENLSEDLMEIAALKSDLMNLQNRVGVYYVSETNPEPANGYKDFYDEVHADLYYPESARENGIEGTVFVKFIVDADGEISHAYAVDNIDSDNERVVNMLEENAEDAILETSGKWNPAKIGGISVAHWMVLPVQYDLKNNIYRPVY